MGTLNTHLSPESLGAERWPRRTVLNLVVRGLVLAVPIGASVIAGVALSHLVASPNGVLATLAWYALILIPSLVVLVVVDHFARRFLPLAVLLRLSLVFPDRAPSRLAVALHAGNPRRLAAYLQESTEAGRSSDTETILTLAAALNAHDRRTRGHSERVRALSTSSRPSSCGGRPSCTTSGSCAWHRRCSTSAANLIGANGAPFGGIPSTARSSRRPTRQRPTFGASRSR